jgi:hypothetical protein
MSGLGSLVRGVDVAFLFGIVVDVLEFLSYLLITRIFVSSSVVEETQFYYCKESLESSFRILGLFVKRKIMKSITLTLSNFRYKDWELPWPFSNRQIMKKPKEH